jgi:DNA polymerase-3 subunit beta
MKIEILQENLLGIVGTLHKLVPSKPSLPILTTILLETEASTIQGSATDLFLGLRAHAPAKIIEPGKAAVPGKLLAEIISSLGPGKLVLTLTDSKLEIKSSDSTATLQCQNSDDFPDFPAISGQVTNLDRATFQEIWQRVSFCVSQDLTRPVLTGVLFDPLEEGFSIVGTDGFRLAMVTLESPLPLPRLLVPAKAWSEIWRAANSEKVNALDLTYDEALKQVLVKVADYEFFIRTIDGDYPPYRKILPSTLPVKASLDAAELTQHLKRALVYARDSSYIVHFELTEAELVIKATSAAAGELVSRLPLKHLGDIQVGKIAFNAKYLQDFLSAVGTGKNIILGMSESLKPAEFSLEDDSHYRYVVMPFRASS